ncbi:hypothetical protein [Olivibacter jilunii]|uniref:hypothetical protein n=1 Tax=Olivibacter jilunii TaxID=985016 RepID=UPI00103114EB|nr:hypothetical protein [Olivibacter jilunii]
MDRETKKEEVKDTNVINEKMYGTAEVSVYYEWLFFLTIERRKNGKMVARKVSVYVIAHNYLWAKDSMLQTCKKKGYRFKAINAVKTVRICFAYFLKDGYPSVPVSAYKRLPDPIIPADL